MDCRGEGCMSYCTWIVGSSGCGRECVGHRGRVVQTDEVVAVDDNDIALA